MFLWEEVVVKVFCCFSCLLDAPNIIQVVLCHKNTVFLLSCFFSEKFPHLSQFKAALTVTSMY